ncbi:MAG TPA: S9 family peptidase [Clostridia bacterium]|nr:S9 family peptidase [Clostridia bacterium]
MFRLCFRSGVVRLFVILVLMSSSMMSQTLPAPQAVTDPKKLESKNKPDLQGFLIEKLYMTRAIGGTAWSPDGKQIAFVSNMSGRSNVWTVPGAGGWPTQLTISDQRQMSPAWSPDGRWIAYMSDYDGDEMWEIFVVSPMNGDVVNLTTSRQTAEESPAWSPDGKRLVYTTKPKTSPVAEVDIIDVETRRTVHLTKDTPREWSNSNPIWSKDGKWIAFNQSRADGKDSNIYVAEVATGKLENVTPHTGEHNYHVADWSPDAKQLLITSDAANDYDNVGMLDVASKQIAWLTRDKWEIEAGGFSPDGKLATWTANVDGNVDIFVYDVATKKTEALPIKKGVNSLGGAESAFTKDGSRLLYYHNGADSPNDVWVYDMAPRTSLQVTHAMVAGLRSEDMVEPYLVHYPSKDGKWTLSAWAYVPNNIIRNAKYPAIVYIHGGPTAQSMNGFNRIVQYMVNQGYVVIAPNYRGSTGYGKDFIEANRMDAGGGELQDVVDAAEFIKNSGFIDPKKLIVMGGSYGGYLSMMAVTKFPELWAASVPIVPFVNWFTEFENEDPALQEYDRKFMGDPVKNKALWEDRSPIFFVEKIKAPLLLLAGGNDPRCPKTEAQQVADAVKKRGGVAQLKIYENEGHGFARVENQIDAYKRVSDFLKSHVPSPGCGCSVAF